jgi:hypothetical protein
LRYKELPDWVKEQKRQIRKELGNPTNWGGKRQGSGRPMKPFSERKIKEYTFILKLNPIQQKILTEMGNGNIQIGILKLIQENV